MSEEIIPPKDSQYPPTLSKPMVESIDSKRSSILQLPDDYVDTLITIFPDLYNQTNLMHALNNLYQKGLLNMRPLTDKEIQELEDAF